MLIFMRGPKTLMGAVKFFSDKDNALNYLAEIRWPDGVVCPRCGAEEPTFLKSRRIWKCKGCRKQFSIKVGTIFEDSPIGLDKWMTAMWMLANCKNGVSSHELHRTLGVTQKTAWFMLHRLRLALQGDNGGKLEGEIEVDESYIGGKARNMHRRRVRKMNMRGRGGPGKTGVMAVLQRGGEIRSKVIPDAKKATLQPFIREHVAPGSAVYTDDFTSYVGLEQDYSHQVINHAVKYVDGQVHTNGMENFWSLLKRGLGGTYVSVEPFHLFRYVDEQAWRYNNRKTDDGERFRAAAARIVGKRLTYAEVTGKVGETPF